MTKHQACAKCIRQFVGPDSNIGDNLCPDCDYEVHCKCDEKIAELEAAVAKMSRRKPRLHLAEVTSDHIVRAETLIACGLDVEQVSQMLAEHDAVSEELASLYKVAEKASP